LARAAPPSFERAPPPFPPPLAGEGRERVCSHLRMTVKQ
jgi:hypothetical protein